MTSTSPKDLGLAHETWREGQFEEIEAVAKDPSPIVIVEAPTGRGKTGIAIGTARHNLWKTFALTMNHSLQDQYVSEGNGKVVKVIGRANYQCILPDYDPDEARERGVRAGTTVDVAPCAGGYDCPIKSSCTYFVHRDRGLAAQISAHNYQFWLPESTYSKGFTNADLLVCDEGHLLDGVLSDFQSVGLSMGRLSQLSSWGISLPNSELAVDWAEVGLRGEVEARRVAKEQPLGTVERAKWLSTARFYQKLGEIDPKGERWVVDKGQEGVLIRPVWPFDVKNVLLADKARKALIMSATILDVEMFASVLGLDPADYSYHQMPFVFPPESRPVYYRPAATVTQETFVKAARMLGLASTEWMRNRRGENGVIHTHSYRLQNEILPHIKDQERLIVQEQGMSRTEAIARFKSGGHDKWLVSPSVNHGEDFKLASSQIMVKIPFLDLRDKVVRIRLNQNPRWYKWVAAQTTEQTIGRVTRSETDYGETVILDAKFESILPYMHREIREAVR